MKILCSICNETFDILSEKDNTIELLHDCKLYDSIFQQKRIIQIKMKKEVIKE